MGSVLSIHWLLYDYHVACLLPSTTNHKARSADLLLLLCQHLMFYPKCLLLLLITIITITQVDMLKWLLRVESKHCTVTRVVIDQN